MPRTDTGSGSPAKGEPVYLVVGTLRRAHGIRGEMVMEVHTDFPERLKKGVQVFVGEKHQPLTVASTRVHNEGMLIAFKEINVREETARYRTLNVYVRGDDRPALPAGEFYFHEVIGLIAIDDRTGGELGRVTEIIETGANDVYVITNQSGAEMLIPAIKDVVIKIDPPAGEVRVRLLDGLINPEAE
jgi:16S rRNA processing protein RimM